MKTALYLWVVAGIVALIALAAPALAQTAPAYLTMQVVPQDQTLPSYFVGPRTGPGFPVVDAAECERIKAKAEAQAFVDAAAAFLEIPAATDVYFNCQGQGRKVTVGGGP